MKASFSDVIPAKAGIEEFGVRLWTPAFAECTDTHSTPSTHHSGLRFIHPPSSNHCAFYWNVDQLHWIFAERVAPKTTRSANLPSSIDPFAFSSNEA